MEKILTSVNMKPTFHCMDKFGLIEGSLLKVKEIVLNGKLPAGIFDEFVEACLKRYTDDLKDPQLRVLFATLNEVEALLKERGLSTDSVAAARETLLFVLENNGH